MPEITLEEAPEKVKALFNKGFAAMERGSLDYAIEMLTHCVELEPGFVRARKFLRAAEIQLYRQKKASAISEKIGAVKGLPNYLRAAGLLKAGKSRQSLEVVEKLLKNMPLYPRYLLLFAAAAAAEGLVETAVQSMEIARDYYPNDPAILKTLGGLYIEVERPNDAKACFEKVCAAYPNDPEALRALKNAMALDSMATDGWSKTHEEGGTFREIVKDTTEAQRLEQKSKAVKTEKDLDDLIADARANIENEPENMNYYRSLARLYSQKEMFNEAAEALVAALEKSPGDPELDSALSGVRLQAFEHEISRLRDAGDADGAASAEVERDEFRYQDTGERVKRYPNDLRLKFDWGVMLFERNELNDAIQQFQLAQRNPQNRAQCLYYLAQCFKNKGQYDMAAEQLTTALADLVSMDGTKKDVLYELGQISELVGDAAKAAEYYKQIYQVDIGYRDIAARIEALYDA